MVKVVDGVENVGEEIKCKDCGSIIHFECGDLFSVEYFFNGTKRRNEAVECPKCGWLVYLWER
jgi:hypothetical protein